MVIMTAPDTQTKRNKLKNRSVDRSIDRAMERLIDRKIDRSIERLRSNERTIERRQRQNEAFESNSNCKALGGLAVRIEFKCFVSAPFSFGSRFVCVFAFVSFSFCFVFVSFSFCFLFIFEGIEES